MPNRYTAARLELRDNHKAEYRELYEKCRLEATDPNYRSRSRNAGHRAIKILKEKYHKEYMELVQKFKEQRYTY